MLKPTCGYETYGCSVFVESLGDICSRTNSVVVVHCFENE